MVWDLFLFALGLAILGAGAELVVRSGVRLASLLRVSPVVVGATIIAYGTGLPEFVVSILAVWRGETAVAVGNVVGSNIFNIAGVLGTAALVAPIVVHSGIVLREVPIMLAATLAFVLVAIDGHIAQWEGLLLLLGLVAYTVVLLRMARQEGPAVEQQYALAVEAKQRRASPSKVLPQVGILLGGLLLLATGGVVALEGALGVALSLGVSGRIIGVTLVAVGTSLPEMATSLVAAARRQMDIALGNIVGSNTFNALGIAGTGAIISPLEVVPEALRFEIPIMAVVAVAVFPIVYTGRRVTRGEGAFLLAMGAAFLAMLVLGWGTPGILQG